MFIGRETEKIGAVIQRPIKGKPLVTFLLQLILSSQKESKQFN